MVQERADELNSIETGELLSIIEEVNARYLHRGYLFALLMNNPTIGKDLLDIKPYFSHAWLNGWAKTHNLELKTPQKLEHLRRKYCHKNVLIKFYRFLAETIANIDPELLFNADETALSLDRRGKVVVPSGAFPTIDEDKLRGHYTVMCCFNAVGETLDPFIILPHCKVSSSRVKSLYWTSRFCCWTKWMDDKQNFPGMGNCILQKNALISITLTKRKEG